MRHFRFTWQWRLFQAHVDKLKNGYIAVVFGVGCYCNHQCIFRLVWCARSIQNLLFVQLVARCCASVFHICIDIHCSAYTSHSLSVYLFVYIYIVNVLSCCWAYLFVVRAVFFSSLFSFGKVSTLSPPPNQLSERTNVSWFGSFIMRARYCSVPVPVPVSFDCLIYTYIYICISFYFFFFVFWCSKCILHHLNVFLFYYTVQCFQFK